MPPPAAPATFPAMREQIAVMLMSCLGGWSGGGTDGEQAVELRPEVTPLLMVQDVGQPDSIYAPPGVGDSQGGYNDGALSIGIFGRYMTDYIYRGLEVVEPPTREDSINFQLGADLRLDLG